MKYLNFFPQTNSWCNQDCPVSLCTWEILSDILLKPLGAYLYQAHLRGAYLREGSHLIYQKQAIILFSQQI